MAVIDVLGGTEQDVLDLQAQGRPPLPSIDRRRFYVSDGGNLRCINVDGFDQFDVNQTIWSYRGAARKWSSALAARTSDNPAKMIWWGDSVSELMYGNPLFKFRDRAAIYNNGRRSPGWINAAPLSSDVISHGGGGVNLLRSEAFRLSTGTYGDTGKNVAQERGLGLYAFLLKSGSTMTLYSDPNNDGTWTDQVVASLSWAKAEIHYTAFGTDASVGSLEFRVDGVLEETINGYDATLASGQEESGHHILWDSGTNSTAHTITVTATGGDFVFEGMYLANHDETLWIYNGGNAGEHYDKVLEVFTNHYKAPIFEVTEQLNPAAIQFAYGINDYGVSGDPGEFGDNITSVIGEVRQATADPTISVAAPYATGSRADWDEWVVAVKDICSDENVPVLDLSWMLDGPASSSDPFDLVETEGGQHVHLSLAGGEFWADEAAKFWFGTNVNWMDVLETHMDEVEYRFLSNKVSAAFTGDGFSPALVISKHDAGKAYLLLQDDKTSLAATTGLFGEVGINGRGATTLLGASGVNGLAGFRFRAPSTWTDTSAPTDIEIFNCAASSITIAVRHKILAGGGITVPEQTVPAGAADTAILVGRDSSGKTEAGFVMPDSSFRAVAGNDYTNPHINPRISLQPSGWLASTVDRSSAAITNVATLTTQKLFLVSIELLAGMIITNISFHSGTTALGTPSNWWFSLHDASRNLLRQTANQTTGAWAANTLMPKALTSTYAITVSGQYYVGIMCHATTMPTLLCSSPNALVAAIAPIMQGNTSDTGLTTTAPNPAGAITSGNTRAFAGVS